MLKKFREEDFLLLKYIAKDRLSPPGISIGFIGLLGFSVALALFFWNATDNNDNITNPIWPSVIKLSFNLLIIQGLITIFYLNNKTSYYFQKFQIVLLCLLTLKISIEAYIGYFIICEDVHAPQYMTSIGLYAMYGGFIVLLISIIRAFKRVKQGEFTRDGNGMFNYKESKGYVSIPIIFGATVMGGVAANAFTDLESQFATIADVSFPLFLAILIQYAIYMAWPEFLLLAYCKFRFKSFNISPPNRRKMKGAKK